MSYTNASSNLLGIGDVLSVLSLLGLDAFTERQRACALLGYSLSAPLPAYRPPQPLPPTPSQPPQPKLKHPEHPISAPKIQDFENEPSATDFPPLERGKFEDLVLASGERPTRNPLAPRSNILAAPAKRPLLSPRYERTLLHDLCSVEKEGSQPDIKAIVGLIAQQVPLAELPCLMCRRIASRVTLWLDVSQSMQVFDEDLNRLETTVYRQFKGCSEVSVSRWVGIPRPVNGRDIPARQVVLLASDLGGGGPKAERVRLRTSVRYLHTWSHALQRTKSPMSLLVPLPSRRWESALCQGVKGIEWSRRSQAGRTMGDSKRRLNALIESLMTNTVTTLELRRLARACSLCVRITPALLRHLRLEILPHLGPEAEAELWASSFTREASAFAAVLMPREADALRLELPHYAELVSWLEQSGFLTDAERASLRPTVSIDDGFDDLWVGSPLPPNRAVAPKTWRTAHATLAAVINRQDCLGKAVAAFPKWRDELETFAQGRSPVFAEQVRQIGLLHAAPHPHLQLEDALTWHSLQEEYGDAASAVRLNALISAIQIMVVEPESVFSTRRMADWLKRRYDHFSEAIRTRPDVQRIIRIIQRSTAGSAMPPTGYDPADIYIALRDNEALLSLAPLPEAFRIRSEACGSGPLTISHGSVCRQILLRVATHIKIDHATGDDLRIQTSMGDIYVIPLKQATLHAEDAKFWLDHAAAEVERHDWIAVMRWADKAAASADIEISKLLHATTMFVEAACCADRRVLAAFDRIAFIEDRLSPGSDCLESAGVTAEALLRLAIARVELCLEDSRLAEAIHLARQYLGALRVRGFPADLLVQAARLGARSVEAFLKRGEWLAAREMLSMLKELTLRNSKQSDKIQSWYAIAYEGYSSHTMIRKDGKFALRLVLACHVSDDWLLAAELERAKLELKAWVATGGATDSDFRSSLATARRCGKQSLISGVLRRIARHTFNSGQIQDATRFTRQLSEDLEKIRSPRTKAGVLEELVYQARLRNQASLKDAEDGYRLVPSEETTLKHGLLEEYLRTRNNLKLDHISSSNPTVRELLEYWGQSNNLGNFANLASDVAFEPNAEWVATLLYRHATGSTPADALNNICQTLGASQCSINIFAKIAYEETDPTRAARYFRRAMQITEKLNVAAYAIYSSKLAADRFVQWEKWKTPGQHRDANETARCLIDRALVLCFKKDLVAGIVDLLLIQAAIYYLLGRYPEALTAAKRAQQVATQIDCLVQGVSSYVQEGCFAFQTGALLEAAGALHTARKMWSEFLVVEEKRHQQTELHPYDFGYIGNLLLDACEWFAERSREDLSPAEISFIDDIVWFVNEFYVPRLPESSEETNWINDLWYAVSQVQKLPLPNVIIAYDALAEAVQHREPNSSLITRFQKTSQYLKDLLNPPAQVVDNASSSHDIVMPTYGPGPLISQTTRFLTFIELPEAGPWLHSVMQAIKQDSLINRSEQVLRVAKLDFWPGANLLAIGVVGHQDQSEQFALFWENDEFVMLDWTNEPIYSTISKHPLSCETDEQVISYTKFFFKFVRGQLGRFLFVETIDEVPWLAVPADNLLEDTLAPQAEQPTAAILSDFRAKVTPFLQPLTVVQRQNNVSITLEGTVIFKNALFRTKILLSLISQTISTEDQLDPEEMSSGQLKLFDEELLVENLPVFVDEPPGVYG